MSGDNIETVKLTVVAVDDFCLSTDKAISSEWMLSVAENVQRVMHGDAEGVAQMTRDLTTYGFAARWFPYA